jgi:hypothetical protein
LAPTSTIWTAPRLSKCDSVLREPAMAGDIIAA